MLCDLCFLCSVLGAIRHEARRWIFNPLTPFKLLITVVVLQPLRYLGAWLLKRASQNRKGLGIPPLFDMVRPESNPVILILQYYASMLDGSCKTGNKYAV